jgi:hypothetical protein
MAEMTVRVEGTVSTTSASGGTGSTAGTAGFTKITDGTDTADVALPGPNLGAALVTTTGTILATTTLSAASATGAGSVADFGSAKANVSLVVIASAGTTAGAVALEVSQDNTNWYRHITSIDTTAPGVFQTSTNNLAFRYARANITTLIVGGTVTATLMAT